MNDEQHVSKVLGAIEWAERAKPSRIFDGCVPLVGITNNSYLAEEISPDVIWPIRVNCVMPSYDPRDGKDPMFLAIRPASIKELRGKPLRPCRQILRITQGAEFGGRFTEAHVFAGWDGKKWLSAVKDKRHEEFLDSRAWLYPSIALTNRYSWHVLIGGSDHARVAIQTDATGVHQLFAERESTNDRRPALMHWVKRHWRQSRSDSAIEHSVRAHLRGSRKFHWMGWDCEVRCSAYDQTLLENEKAQPGEIRASA